MMPVSFRILHQKRSFVLKSTGNLIESYFGKKKKKKKPSNNTGFSCQSLTSSGMGSVFHTPQVPLPAVGQPLPFPACFLKIQF